jgi:methanogen homoaconitase small subunit
MNRIWLFGNDIDTDQIIPGRYSPYMTSEDELSQYAFIENRPEFAAQVQPGDVIVAGRNFGCGSSREYAPRALQKCGIASIIAPSFARIFFRNAINLGIPLFKVDLTREVADGEQVTLDIEGSRLLTPNGAYDLPPQPEFVQQIQREGGIVAYYRRYNHFPGESDAQPG